MDKLQDQWDQLKQQSQTEANSDGPAGKRPRSRGNAPVSSGLDATTLSCVNALAVVFVVFMGISLVASVFSLIGWLDSSNESAALYLFGLQSSLLSFVVSGMAFCTSVIARCLLTVGRSS